MELFYSNFIEKSESHLERAFIRRFVDLTYLHHIEGLKQGKELWLLQFEVTFR
jgi:hypothetical protein